MGRGPWGGNRKGEGIIDVVRDRCILVWVNMKLKEGKLAMRDRNVKGMWEGVGRKRQVW